MIRGGLVSSCFGGVVDASELSLKAGDVFEPLDFNRGVIFKLKGGYSSDFLTVTGTTSIHGSITISAGTVTIDGITIQ